MRGSVNVLPVILRYASARMARTMSRAFGDRFAAPVIRLRYQPSLPKSRSNSLIIVISVIPRHVSLKRFSETAIVAWGTITHPFVMQIVMATSRQSQSTINSRGATSW